MKEGLQEGRQEGQAETLTQLMRMKFGELSAGQAHRIQRADEETLRRWLKQALPATTLDEALR